jgi:hypothetical protein
MKLPNFFLGSTAQKTIDTAWRGRSEGEKEVAAVLLLGSHELQAKIDDDDIQWNFKDL